MNYELITPDEYEALPEDPEQQFVEIERLCRAALTRMIDENTRGEFDDLVRMQYMTTVAAAADELGIEGLIYPHDAEYPAQEINTFLLRASGLVTRIRLRSGNRSRPYSVQLARRTKARIEIEIGKLRGLIEEAGLPTAKQNALIGKLDDMLGELNQPRLSFARTMAIMAFVAVGISEATSFAADAPTAIETIVRLIGADKAAEEREVARLAPPPRALPSPAKVEPPKPAFDSDLDDDVPF